MDDLVNSKIPLNLNVNDLRGYAMLLEQFK